MKRTQSETVTINRPILLSLLLGHVTTEEFEFLLNLNQLETLSYRSKQSGVREDRIAAKMLPERSKIKTTAENLLNKGFIERVGYSPECHPRYRLSELMYF